MKHIVYHCNPFLCLRERVIKKIIYHTRGHEHKDSVIENIKSLIYIFSTDIGLKTFDMFTY